MLEWYNETFPRANIYTQSGTFYVREAVPDNFEYLYTGEPQVHFFLKQIIVAKNNRYTYDFFFSYCINFFIKFRTKLLRLFISLWKKNNSNEKRNYSSNRQGRRQKTADRCLGEKRRFENAIIFVSLSVHHLSRERKTASNRGEETGRPARPRSVTPSFLVRLSCQMRRLWRRWN